MPHMSVTLRYFASLREQLGTDTESLNLSSETTVGAIREQLSARGGVWAIAFSSERILSSVNHQMAGPDVLVSADDEVAFFPPVTGG